MSGTKQHSDLNNQMRHNQILTNIRAVSFDLDDTFWDCEPAIVRAEAVLRQWLDRHHPELSAAHSPQTLQEMRTELYTTHEHLATDVTLMRKTLLTQLFNAKPNSEQLADQAFDVFYKERSNVELYDGTHEILAALKPDYKLAAITNGNADLELIGLADYFHEIRRADLNNPPKPAIDMFQSCCKVLDVAAGELLHVGDNPHTDVLGGHNAGVRTVWFNQARATWPDDLPRADIEVQSLAELQQLLTSKT